MKKTTNLLKAALAVCLLAGSAILLTAQTTPTQPICPLGNTPGYGRTLTPEQRTAHQAAMRQYVAELRQKQAQGTLTAEEQTWLKQVEERGGMNLTGTPRGPGAGRGRGAGMSLGVGQRQGLRDGTGPGCVTGACPLGNTPGYCQTLTPEQRTAYQATVQQYLAELRQKQAQGKLTAEEQAWLKQVEQRGGLCLTGTPRGPGAGQGRGAGMGMGAGQRQRLGLRDGTGPGRAAGTCPLVTPPQTEKAK